MNLYFLKTVLPAVLHISEAKIMLQQFKFIGPSLLYKTLMATSATPQHTSRCIYVVNGKILSHFLLELSCSQDFQKT